jgi:uncharacterized metal-binding protein
VFRFIWLPYYKACHLTPHYRVNGKVTHRSFLAHTPILGTLSRMIYLAVPLVLLGGVSGQSLQWLQAHPRLLIEVAIGLEIGSLIHIISDWVWSELR